MSFIPTLKFSLGRKEEGELGSREQKALSEIRLTEKQKKAIELIAGKRQLPGIRRRKIEDVQDYFNDLYSEYQARIVEIKGASEEYKNGKATPGKKGIPPVWVLRKDPAGQHLLKLIERMKGMENVMDDLMKALKAEKEIKLPDTGERYKTGSLLGKLIWFRKKFSAVRKEQGVKWGV